ncbi:hypothetical protein Tsubulata_024967 [Turnera subulata]|uniref:Uncharacterized protein n=1 Tax=Turnera subulata TaxID=218843 RepID=A0A9Q0JEY8_9ROSI|nr:hypothetical protein Tsubulata_024967 [Turnera subulata]
MLIRSSSTGTCRLAPFSESPKKRDFETFNHTHINYIKHHPFFNHHKLSSSSSSSSSLLNLAPLTTSGSSPVSEYYNQETNTTASSGGGLRRAFSDSNLERLAGHSRHESMLHTAPSLSIFNQNDGLEGEEGKEEALMRTATIGESIEAKGSGDFSFGSNTNMGLIEEEGEEEQDGGLNGIEKLGIEDHKEPVSPPMYLAAGLGIDGIDLGGDGRGGGLGGVDLITLPQFDGVDDAEDYYKRMINGYPCHPLFLSNYARLLQSKGDLHGAEDYFHRAALADPNDGEILMQHAKLDWELHHDQNRALANFERAVQTAPHDSHVLAAYASFLWEVDNDEEETSQTENVQVGDGILNRPDNLSTSKEFTPLQLSEKLKIAAGGHVVTEMDKGENTEDNYRKMVEENPCNSLVLRNYAEFLYQTKGDLRGAEEFYSRAVLADPGDGEIMAQYAKLVWELHHDQDKALCYFESAVEAAPGNSYVLGAYASFLWDIEEDEDDGISQFQVHKHDECAVTAAASV